MREIKFRGKNFCRSWVYGDLRHDRMCMPDGRLQEYISVCGEPIHPDTVGQFTGLKDCKGREIYEGDVIRSDFVQHMRTDVCNGYVVYKNGAFYVEYIDHTYANLGDLIFYSGATTSVIGNVYDNPELLKLTKK